MVTWVLLPLLAALTKATPVPARWSRPDHFTPYRFSNSPNGLRKSAKGRRRIDLDFQETADNRWAWTHWARPGREGFRYTKASVAIAAVYGIRVRAGALCLRTCKSMPYPLVASLRHRDGSRIGTAAEALTLAAELGVQVEVETKGTPPLVMLEALAVKAADVFGAGWREWVQVKRLASLSRWRTVLRRAKLAGFHTIVINYQGNPAKLPAYVDHYRR